MDKLKIYKAITKVSDWRGFPS